jgi:ABC-2 type transport system ATP-binding protein
MSDGLAVEAIGLEKRYGSVKALSSVELQVERGIVYGLLGPNGAGKTTIVRILSTLTKADGGWARVAGFDVSSERHQVRRIISLAGQHATVDTAQSAEENLSMMSRLAGLSAADARRRARELLERFDLADARHRRVATYSGGMRRRLDLAATLVGRPSVLFLDEPTTGLDLRGRQVVWDVLTGLAGSGLTVFLTTQYLEEADKLADRIAVIDRGRMVAEGTPSELKERVATNRLDLLLADWQSFERVRRTLGGRVLHSDPARHTIGAATDGTARHIRALLDEIDPHGSSVRQFAVAGATLDDVFLALTGQAYQATESAHV